MEINGNTSIKELTDAIAHDDISEETDELTHWGIKGMRWGVRRYQNKDGSLTAKGKKRYNEEMAKIKAETKKVKNQQKTTAKLNKLEAAKKNLKNLKKGKTDSENIEETDEQKRERILQKPTAKDVYENRHLFSNREVGDLYIRLNNEEAIKRLVPKEVDPKKAKADQLVKQVEDLTVKAVSIGKAYNLAATVFNAFSPADSKTLPKLDLDNMNKGNKEQRRQEELRDKAERERRQAAAKAEKERQHAAAKAEKERRKAAAKADKEQDKTAKASAEKQSNHDGKNEQQNKKVSNTKDSSNKQPNRDRKAQETVNVKNTNAKDKVHKTIIPALPPSTSNLPATTTNRGRSAAEKFHSYELRDRDGNIILSYGSDD